MSMGVIDGLMVLRDKSKNSSVVNAAEAASTNARRVTPGLYTVVVRTTGAVTGGPTTATLTIQDSADGSSFAALDDNRVIDFTTSKWNAANVVTMRGVRIVRNGNPNVGAAIALSGGTSPTIPGLEISLHPIYDMGSFLGQP